MTNIVPNVVTLEKVIQNWR